MPEKPETVMDALKQKIQDFKDSDPNQKLIILAVFALIISTMVVFTFWMNRANFRVLYSNLSVEDAGKITTALKDKKVTYRLEDGGRTILVPTDQLHQLRLDLAGSGLPQSGNIGFELFDKSDFQSSDFSENVKYIRALQGELSNTIRHLDSVEDCRINLAIPQRRIYLDEDTAPSASVVLKLAGGQQISDEEVRGVARLVAGTVQGLKIENISIMSTDGRLLSEFLQEGDLGLATYQLRIRNELQKSYESRINGLLNSVLGRGKAVVKVNVEIETEKKAIQKEIFQPVDGNVGVVRSSRTMIEDYNNKNLLEQEPPAVQGATRLPLAGAGDDNALYQQKSTTTNYEISKTIESQSITPGQVKRLTIGVLVDSNSDITPEQVADLKDVISSIAGIDQARGDILTIRTIGFEIPEPLTGAESADEIMSIVRKYAAPVFSAFAPLIILLMLMGMFKKSKKERPSSIDVRVGASDSMGLQVPREASVTGMPEGSDMGSVESDPVVAELSSTLKGIVEENPKLVARAFENWASAGGN